MKIIPYGMPWIAALRKGYLGRIQDRKYLDWVKTLPCVVCGSVGVDPSHYNGDYLSGMGTKSPDYTAFPCCRQHHDELHHDQKGWEEKHGAQSFWSMMTLVQAAAGGYFNKEKP